MERSFPQELHSFGRRRIGAMPQEAARARSAASGQPIPSQG